MYSSYGIRFGDPYSTYRRGDNSNEKVWLGLSRKSKKAGVAGQGPFQVRPSYLSPTSALYAMADFNPAPLFSSANEETGVADTGSLIINHGGTTDTTNPLPPDREPGKQVRLHLSLPDVHLFLV